MSMSYYMPYSLYCGVDLGVMGGSIRIMEKEHGNYIRMPYSLFGVGLQKFKGPFLRALSYGLWYILVYVWAASVRKPP